jgi:hypothetical protein
MGDDPAKLSSSAAVSSSVSSRLILSGIASPRAYDGRLIKNRRYTS